MHEEHEPFTWLGLIPGLHGIESHVLTAILIAALLVIGGVVAVAQMRAATNPVVPEGRLSFRGFFELVAEKLLQLCQSVMGEKEAQTYFPLIATLFVFIFVSNIIGLIPGFLPPTDNINTTLALGVFVFIFYNLQGLKAHGIGYLKHFLGPVWYLAPLMLVIEVVSHVFRPISLGLRLRGNIMGDHIVLHVFTDLTKVGLPIIFYGMGVFVSFIQAFVFCLLTMVYISLSTAHDH